MIKLCNTPIDDKYIIEKLTFIVDHPKLRDDAKYEYARNFVKSFGFKSDSVGWVSNITPNPEVLEKIFEKAKAEGVSIRADYSIELSQDYECRCYYMIGNPKGGYLAASEWGRYNGYIFGEVKAYSVPDNIRFTRIGCTDFLMLREDVVREIEAAGFTGVDFVWCPDKGRYRSPQYFQAFSQRVIPYWFQCTRRELTEDAACNLTDSAKILARNSKECFMELPMAVDSDLLSHYDFAATYPENNHDNRLLVRKSVRDHLIEKGLAKPSDFEPVFTADNLTTEQAAPLVKRYAGKYVPLPEDVRAHIAKEYEKSLKKEKPIRAATEKGALAKLRAAKKEDPEMFGKKASEKKLANIIDLRLIPYYKVADGGAISDEYSFFSIDDALKENDEFWALQSLEENDIIPSEAKVFGVAADGENIILLPDGAVVRYQQGEVQLNSKWNDLPSFFTEAIDE